MNEVLKYILLTCGPAVFSVGIIVYMFFWFKGYMNNDTKKLKDSLSAVIRENAELKKELKDQHKKMDEYVDKLGKFIEELEEVEDNE